MAARSSCLGIEPDLTTLGKIVGGGLPVGAYGGRAEVMDHVLPAGKVFQAGTLSGNPLATAAGCAMLRALRDDPPYERLEQLSARLEAGLRDAAAAAGVPHQFARVGSMMTLFFAAEPVTDWPIGQPLRHARDSRASSGRCWSAASICRAASTKRCSSRRRTREADIDATIAAAREALADQIAGDTSVAGDSGRPCHRSRYLSAFSSAALGR